jgi:hypothetical protein
LGRSRNKVTVRERAVGERNFFIKKLFVLVVFGNNTLLVLNIFEKIQILILGQIFSFFVTKIKKIFGYMFR